MEKQVQNNTSKVFLMEKIIAILSYITMGIVGLIWFVIAYFTNKRLKYFLMYNIAQSMIIAIFLTIIKLAVDIILSIFAKIPFLDFIAAKLYYNVISFKIIRIYSLGLSLSFFELLLFLLLIYIIAGVIAGRIFYIPYLTNFMYKAMKNYN